MSGWKQTLREGWAAGSAASAASAAALLFAGQRETGHPAAPVNAISHWVWDRPAYRQDPPSLRHTLVGYLVHHGASVFWATLYAAAWARRREQRRAPAALATAAAAAAVACFVDLRMTPERLTPGYEHRLSGKAMAAVYVCFAVGLAAGAIAAGPKGGGQKRA
jgi:hypothetical protein